MTHTPAPWTVGKFQGNGFLNQVQIDPTIGVAYGDEAQAMANARLISAAPELLEALKEARFFLIGVKSPSHKSTLQRINAAINKAEGEEE